MLDLRSWVYALHYITKLLTLTVPGRRVDDYVALAGENTMLLLTLVHVLKEVSGYQMTGDVPLESPVRKPFNLLLKLGISLA